MIKANEIMVGNWIFDDSDEQTYRRVEQIRKDGDGFKGYYIIHRNGSAKSLIEHEDSFIQPIPLTPEILEQCGFVIDGNGTYWINLQTHYLELINGGDSDFYPVYAQLPEISSESEQRVSLNRVKYLHELQNLFYSLRGEELTFQPIKELT
jgi:hypothetical protein